MLPDRRRTAKGGWHLPHFDAADGIWRVAFVFDPYRKTIILVAGDKPGVSDKRFYRQLIDNTDARLAAVKRQKEKERM